MTIYKEALQKKLRFVSAKVSGQMTAEQLFDLPLKSVNGPSLDDVGIVLMQTINQQQSVSLVDGSTTVASDNDLRLKIIKDIIATRKEESMSAVEAAKRRTEIADLRNALANKRSEAVANLSVEELENKLKELEA